MLKSLEYMEKNKQVGCFGIPYLDNKLRGILQGDLILIGSRSGAGKSTIAQMIACANSTQGRKVSLLSLENFVGDEFMQKCFYFYIKEARDFNLNIRDFISGNFNINLDALEASEKYAENYFKNVSITSRKKGFNLQDMKDAMVKDVVEKGIRLIILDHLDYVDKFNQNDSDISHVSEIMRTIRNLQDEFKVGVIAISHLRKPHSVKDMPAVPSVDEFIGSSNKVKEATVVVLIAPDDVSNSEFPDSKTKATWCCVRKLRLGGIDNKVAKLFFDVRIGEYLPKYDMYSVNYAGTEQKLLNDEQ